VKFKDTINDLVAYVITSFFIIVILLVLKYYDFNLSDPLTNIFAQLIAMLIVGLIVVSIMRKSAKNSIDSYLTNSANGKQHGLVKIYDNFVAAEKDIKELFIKSNNVKILLQLGRDSIDGKKSLLYEQAIKRYDPIHIKLLFADVDSDFLSKDKANERKSSKPDWERSYNNTILSIKAIRATGKEVDARTHSEPYLWRLYFLDDTLFFVPYLYDKKNHENAPVFRFEKLEKGSFYKTFETYFDNLWDKQAKSSC